MGTILLRLRKMVASGLRHQCRRNYTTSWHSDFTSASYNHIKRAAFLRYLLSPKPTTPVPGSYIIKPSPAAADPDHHNNTVKYILKRVYGGDTAVTNALHFSNDELSNKDGFVRMDRYFSSPYFDKTNSIGGRVGRWVHLQNLEGEPLLWDPSTDDVVFLQFHGVPVPPGTPELVSSCFGYDSASGDSKLIRFMNYRTGTGHRYEDGYRQTVLYSMKRDSWKEITASANENSNIYFTPAHVNGVAYWTGKHSITSFDFAKECFNEVSLPHGINEETHSCKAVEVDGGLLGLIVYEESGKDKCFKLWVRESSKWARVMKWSVNVCGAEMPLGLSKDGRILFLQAVDHELLEYDLAAREVKKTGIYGFLWQMALLPHVELASMTPVHSDGVPKAMKGKAKMRVLENVDLIFASDRKWKITYGDGAMRGLLSKKMSVQISGASTEGDDEKPEVCDIYKSNADYTRGLRQAIGVREFEDYTGKRVSRLRKAGIFPDFTKNGIVLH